MTSERLSKLQKWILIHCYLKTIKHQLPEKWNYPTGHNYEISLIERDLKSDDKDRKKSAEFREDILQNHLFRSEILRNYFNLRLSYKQCFWSAYGDKFKDTPEYRKALVTLSRSLKLLSSENEGDGYIDCWCNSFFHWKGYTLTKTGISKAIELLNVNSGKQKLTINIKTSKGRE